MILAPISENLQVESPTSTSILAFPASRQDRRFLLFDHSTENFDMVNIQTSQPQLLHKFGKELPSAACGYLAEYASNHRTPHYLHRRLLQAPGRL